MKCVVLSWLLLAATVNPVPAQTFASVTIGGGGYVDGLISCPAQTNLFYARTDVGGAYRWDEPSQSWISLLDWCSPSQTSYQGVESIAVDPESPNRLYMVVGTSYWNNDITAVLCSTNYGANFTVVNVTSLFQANGNGNDRNKGEELAVDPNLGSVLICGSRANGLFKSTNYGATWTAVSSFNTNLTPPSQSISFVKFDPKSGSPGFATPRIFVGVFSTGNNLFVSNDGGVTWSAVTGSPAASVPERCELANNNLLYVAYGINNTGCLMSYNVTNQVWANCTPGGVAQTYGAISVCVTNPNLMIATTYSVWDYQPSWGGYGDKIYVSTNAGTSWIDLFGNDQINMNANGFPWVVGSAIHWAGTIVMDPFNPNRIFVGSGQGVWSTTNLNSGRAASTWNFTDKGLEETVPITFLSVPRGPFISSVRDVNGYVHTNIQVAPSSRISQSSGLAYAAQLTNFVVQAVNGGGLNYSTGLPVTWTAFATTPSGMAGGTPAVGADGKTVLWNTTVSNVNTCYVTANFGASWTASTGLTFGCAPLADPVNPSKFYAYNSGNGYAYASTNGGLSFLSSGYAGSGGSMRFAVAPGLEGHLWIATYGGGLQYSTNSGVSFSSAGVAEADAVTFGKTAPGATYPTLFIWGRPTGSSTVGMYRSTDRAASWVRVNDNAHQYGGLGGGTGVIEGDKNSFGRVFMSSAGRGMPYIAPAPQSNYYNQAVFSCAPSAFYELNELSDPSAGGVPAYDCAGGYNGTYGATTKNGFNGISGPVPPTYPGFLTNNSALKTTGGDGNSIVTLPNLNLNTNTITILAWIKPNTLAVNRGIVFCRGNGTTAGLCLGNAGDNALGYNWNNNADAYNWDSVLVPNTNEWAMAALVVSPSNAVIYLISPTKGVLAATNNVANGNQSFANPTTIGADVYSTATRTWDGGIDEVAIFNSCLSASQIKNLYNAGLGTFRNPPIIGQQPAGLTIFTGSTANLSFSANGAGQQYQWMSGPVGSGTYTNVPLGGRISVQTNGTLVISNVQTSDQLDYVVVVSNMAGAVVSSPATLTVLQPNAPLGPIYSVNGLAGTGGGTGDLTVTPSIAPAGSTALTDLNQTGNLGFGPGFDGTPGRAIASGDVTRSGTECLAGTLGPASSLGAFTITFWVNSATAAYNNQRILDVSTGSPPTTGTADGNVVFISWNGYGGIQYKVNNGGGDIAFESAGGGWNGGPLVANTWYYVALTYDSVAGAAYLFTGGTNIPATEQWSFSSGVWGSGVAQFSNSTSIMLLNRPVTTASNSRGFPGAIDNVNIYAGALTASQIEAVRYTEATPTNTIPYVAAPIVTPGTTVTALTPVTLTGVAGGYQPAYQWQTDGGSGGSFTNISYATNLVLSLIPLNRLVAYNLRYQLVVSNASGGGAVTSPVAILTVNPAPIVKPASVLLTSVSILQGTNVQLVGSNYPVGANAAFNVLCTTNLSLGLSIWFTNGNIVGSRSFDGTDGRFTNVAINAVTNAQVFFRIQVP